MGEISARLAKREHPAHPDQRGRDPREQDSRVGAILASILGSGAGGHSESAEEIATRSLESEGDVPRIRRHPGPIGSSWARHRLTALPQLAEQAYTVVVQSV